MRLMLGAGGGVLWFASACAFGTCTKGADSHAFDAVGWIDAGCVGTAIGPHWIVTAAHCNVSTATFSLTGLPAQGVVIDRCIVPQDFAMGQGTDIAVCHVSTPLGVHAVLDAEEVETSTTLTAVGFAAEPGGRGLRTWTGLVSGSGIELEVELPANSVCAGASGGPAFVVRDGKRQLAAIASSRRRGTSCTDGSKVNYTKISAAREWLQQVLPSGWRDR